MNSREINRRLAKLDALESGGVDNWEFYGESLSSWHKDNHVDECIDDAISEINELLTEAVIDEPAGRGCGHSIEFNEDKMHNLLQSFLNKAEDK
jgi:hypothetical protein